MPYITPMPSLSAQTTKRMEFVGGKKKKKKMGGGGRGVERGGGKIQKV